MIIFNCYVFRNERRNENDQEKEIVNINLPLKDVQKNQ